MTGRRRRKSSLRATVGLVVGVVSLAVALVSLLVARVTLSELRRLKAEIRTSRVLEDKLQKLWAQRPGPAPRERAPAPAKPWYGLCPVDGARSVAAFRASVARSPLLTRLYADFDWAKARAVTLDRPRLAYVNYVKGGRVGWTRNRLTLARGETVITDGVTTVRGFCCNEVTDAPSSPTLPDEPVTALLQPPEERSAGPVPPPEEIWDSAARPGAGDLEAPEPGSWLLVGTGVLALAGILPRRRTGPRGRQG